MCEVTDADCDCDTVIPISLCVEYPVNCPPTSQVPAGYTHGALARASSCDQVVLNSVCDATSGQCECQDDDLRYGGPGCHPNVRGNSYHKSLTIAHMPTIEETPVLFTH